MAILPCWLCSKPFWRGWGWNEFLDSGDRWLEVRLQQLLAAGVDVWSCLRSFLRRRRPGEELSRRSWSDRCSRTEVNLGECRRRRCLPWQDQRWESRQSFFRWKVRSKFFVQAFWSQVEGVRENESCHFAVKVCCHLTQSRGAKVAAGNFKNLRKNLKKLTQPTGQFVTRKI